MTVLSDGAGQFDVFVHALCWLHVERPLERLVPHNEKHRQAIEQIRQRIWGLYTGLKAYRQAPTADVDLSALDEDTACAEALKDPAAERIDAVWEQEWEHRVLAEAFERVRQTANPKHYQVFDYCVLKEWSVAKVAAARKLAVRLFWMLKTNTAYPEIARIESSPR